MEEFPHLQKLYRSLHSHGLRMVAVNTSDDAATIRKYRKTGGFTFDLVLDGKIGGKTLSDRYGVEAVPTNYVLDPAGRVVFRSVGYDEAGVRKALAKLGVR